MPDTRRLSFFQTPHDWTLTILRMALGFMILPHGAQKLLGSFGGYGFSGTMQFMTTTGGLPWIIAFLVIIGEFFGGLGLITGFMTRFSAAAIGVILTFAGLVVHRPFGFFMNWMGTQKGEGIEFFILAVSIALAVTIRGAGAFSVDRWLSARSAVHTARTALAT